MKNMDFKVITNVESVDFKCLKIWWKFPVSFKVVRYYSADVESFCAKSYMKTSNANIITEVTP